MAIVVSPAYPVVDEECTLGLTSAVGTERVWQLLTKPSASALPIGFLHTTLATGVPKPTSSRQVLDLACQTDLFTPDVAGEYGLECFDYRSIVGTPSGPHDPCADVRHELKATQTGTVYVGDYLDLPIRTIWGSRATLRMTVVNATVRAAALVDANDEHARVACLSASLTAPLAALTGVAVASLGTALIAGTNDLRAKYEAHRAVAPAVHPVADTTNTVSMTAAGSMVAACELLNSIRRAYLGHVETMALTSAWHLTSDTLSLPVAPESFDLASGWLLMADLRRCYEGHRILTAPLSPACHAAADAVNSLTAAATLDAAVAAVLTEFAKENPTAAAGESDGLLLGAALYGARAVKR